MIDYYIITAEILGKETISNFCFKKEVISHISLEITALENAKEPVKKKRRLIVCS